jgi:hypothetical protein
MAPGATVTYRNGDYITDAVEAAKKADVAIIFATKFQTEGLDVPDLNLPNSPQLYDMKASIAEVYSTASQNPDALKDTHDRMKAAQAIFQPMKAKEPP